LKNKILEKCVLDITKLILNLFFAMGKKKVGALEKVEADLFVSPFQDPLLS
jgi:hypothetical protein